MANMTRICCGVVTCKYREVEPQYIKGKNGYCTAHQIFLQPAAHDADNIVACSEFTEINDARTELQEIANLLLELYTDINDTAAPEVYGTILGIHERIELFLEDQSANGTV